jgi:hypothetical protein
MRNRILLCKILISPPTEATLDEIVDIATNEGISFSQSDAPLHFERVPHHDENTNDWH